MVNIVDMRHKTRKFGDMEPGDAFYTITDPVDNSALCMKLYGDQFEAVSLEDGVILNFTYDEEVIPVDLEIHIVH